MASIFLCYRRTDSPQACRVYDWLVQRFGHDAVFMDVSNIPFAVSFPDFIEQAICKSRVLVVLIGAQWQAKINESGDPVRTELEVALANNISVLPVLIGNTPMPTIEQLPASLSSIAVQNALTVGVLHDFHTHMQMLLPKIEGILGALAKENVVTSDYEVISNTCEGLIQFLRGEYEKAGIMSAFPEWKVMSTELFYEPQSRPSLGVTLFLHRIARLAELLELHFILSIWASRSADEHHLAGWIVRQFERTPRVPSDFVGHPYGAEPDYGVRVRSSDEDPRQIWKMITIDPLRLSLAYVATISPKTRDATVEGPAASKN